MKTLMLLLSFLFLATPVFALKIYHLQGNQYAIICSDGTGYSFSGSANGASEAGALLCNEHGGIANIINTSSANMALKAMETAKPAMHKGTRDAASGLATGKR